MTKDPIYRDKILETPESELICVKKKKKKTQFIEIWVQNHTKQTNTHVLNT